MFSPRRALRRAGKSSKPLPRLDALTDLYDQGFDPRLGEFIMLAGYSGAGKSAFMLWLADQWDLDVLYFSADTSAHDQSARLAACRTGSTTLQVEEAISEGNDERYMSALEQSRITFNFQSQPSMLDVLGELDAYVEVHDKRPEVIVLDNLRNFVAEESFEQVQSFCGDAHELTRRTGSTVFLLHHAQTETRNPETSPPAKGAMKFKPDALPEKVLTLARDGDTLKVANVKARMNKCDASGKTFAEFRADIGRCQFSAINKNAWSSQAGGEWWQQ